MKNPAILKLLPFFGLLFIFAKCEKDTEQIANLPAAVTDYISAHHPGYKIEESRQFTLCSGQEVFLVELEKGKSEMELAFDSEGSYLFAVSEIEDSELPVAITYSIASDYPGYSFEEPNRIDWFDGSQTYTVDVEKGKDEKFVFYRSTGEKICEGEEWDD